MSHPYDPQRPDHCRLCSRTATVLARHESPVSPLDELLELRQWLNTQIGDRTVDRYIDKQRKIAYTRVFDRLTPIIRNAQKIAAEFHFDEPVAKQ